MLNKLLLLAIIPISSGFASEQANFVQVDIEKATYNESELSSSISTGQMKFRQLGLSWNGVNVGITNNDEIFNSEIIRRKNFLGLVGKNLNVGMQLESTSFVDVVKQLNIESSNVLLNPLFLSFGGREFFGKGDSIDFNLKNFNLYCQGNETTDMTSIDGIAKGCLNSSYLNVSEKSQKEALNVIASQVISESEIYISSEISALELTDKSLDVTTSRNTVDIPGYIIETQGANLKCAKDLLTMANLDFDAVLKKCNNEFTADSPKIILKDKSEETRFYGRVEKAIAIKERIQFLIPDGQIADEKMATSLFNLNLTCFKDPENSIFDLHDVIGDCFKYGSIQASDIVSDEDKGKIYKQYEQLINNDKSPTASVKKSNSSLKNMHVFFKDHVMTLNAKAKVPLFGFQNISFQARVQHDKDKKKIVLNIFSAKLPLGIRSVRLLMSQLRKHLVSSIVTIEDNKVIIQL